MQTEAAHFFSDGLQLAADFFWPDEGAGGGGSRPMVIACSGFTGLRNIHPARFARALTARGMPCFGFDYRGFADSEGIPGRVLLEEQIRDILHAAAYAGGDDRVDASRIVLLGWGMGAGLVLDAARIIGGVAGIVCVNGFYNGARVQRSHRGDGGFDDFRRRVEEQRRLRARAGDSAQADPFDIYPLDPESREYVDAVLRNEPGYEAEWCTYELADSLLRFAPEDHAESMRAPLLIAHGDRNMLHPTEEAESLHRRYGGPKELYWIEDAGHTEFMRDEDPKFQALAARVGDWILARIGAP